MEKRDLAGQEKPLRLPQMHEFKDLKFYDDPYVRQTNQCTRPSILIGDNMEGWQQPLNCNPSYLHPTKISEDNKHPTVLVSSYYTFAPDCKIELSATA